MTEKEAMKYTIHHKDHGITLNQLAHVKGELSEAADGFFIKHVPIPEALGPVDNALYGPASGDEPVGEDAVTYAKRGDRPYTDRIIDKGFRPVDYVQAIGTRDGNAFTIFTIFGGPLAPQHPEDPQNNDVEASRKFWNEHALASGGDEGGAS